MSANQFKIDLAYQCMNSNGFWHIIEKRDKPVAVVVAIWIKYFTSIPCVGKTDFSKTHELL